MSDAWWETAVSPPVTAGRGLKFETSTQCSTSAWVLCNRIPGGGKMFSLEVDTVIETSLAKTSFDMKKQEQHTYFQDELWFFVQMKTKSPHKPTLYTSLPNNGFGQKTREKMKGWEVGGHVGVSSLGPMPTASIGVDGKVSRGQNLTVSVNDFEVRKIQRHRINGTEWNLALRYLLDGSEYEGDIYNQKTMVKRKRKTEMSPVSPSEIPVAAEHGFEQKVSNVWQISESLLKETVKLEINVLRRIRKTNASHFFSVCETFEADILLGKTSYDEQVVRVPTKLKSTGVQLSSRTPCPGGLPGNKELLQAQDFLMGRLTKIVNSH